MHENNQRENAAGIVIEHALREKVHIALQHVNQAAHQIWQSAARKKRSHKDAYIMKASIGHSLITTPDQFFTKGRAIMGTAIPEALSTAHPNNIKTTIEKYEPSSQCLQYFRWNMYVYLL